MKNRRVGGVGLPVLVRWSAVEVPAVEAEGAREDEYGGGSYEDGRVGPLEAVLEGFSADVVVERREIGDPVGAELAG